MPWGSATSDLRTHQILTWEVPYSPIHTCIQQHVPLSLELRRRSQHWPRPHCGRSVTGPKPHWAEASLGRSLKTVPRECPTAPKTRGAHNQGTAARNVFESFRVFCLGGARKRCHPCERPQESSHEGFSCNAAKRSRAPLNHTKGRGTPHSGSTVWIGDVGRTQFALPGGLSLQ